MGFHSIQESPNLEEEGEKVGWELSSNRYKYVIGINSGGKSKGILCSHDFKMAAPSKLSATPFYMQNWSIYILWLNS